MRELRAQVLDDRRLDAVEPEAAVVRARAALARLGAADPNAAAGISIVDGHSAAAAPAGEQAREDPLRRLVAPDYVQPGPVALTLLRGGEGLWIDDREIRRLGELPLALRVDPAHAAACVRVAHHCHPIPDDPPGIDLVQQDPVAALGIAVDRAGVPAGAARGRDALRVEAAGYRAGHVSGQVVGEDPAHDLGLLLDDLEPAGLPGDGTIAVGAPAGVAAVADDTLHAAPHLVLQVAQEKLAHEAADPDLDRVGAALVHRDDLDADEGQALVNASKVLLVAADPVDRLDQYEVE